MGEFFYGWRRKVSVLTLMTALLFTIGWVRSRTIADVCSFHCGKQATGVFYSARDSFAFGRYSDDQIHSVFSLPVLHQDTAFDFPEASDDDPGQWSCKRCGLTFFVGRDHNHQRLFWHVPYWSIVIPLILLSAYLLFSKQHKSNPMKITEPASETIA